MLRQLIARGFRNLEPLDWEVGPGCHLLLGATGTGKTSVLEALYAVTTTRSFRTARLADCARREPSGSAASDLTAAEDAEELGFFLAAEVGDATRTRLELSWSETRGLDRRANGERVALSAHLGAQPVLVWSSADVGMLNGDATARRRFVDRGVIHRHPTSLDAYSRYRSLLGQKRSLLRAGGSRSEVAAWNELLADAAVAIVAQRAAFARGLGEAFATAARGSGLPYDELAIEYRPSPRSAAEGVEALRETLDRAIASELAARGPLLGPHRDRIVISWHGAELAQRASSGERKAIGLLLLLAQASLVERARGPVLLLVDEADAELDRTTLLALFPAISTQPQVVLTSNRPEVFEGLDECQRWRLRSGRLEPYK